MNGNNLYNYRWNIESETGVRLVKELKKQNEKKINIEENNKKNKKIIFEKKSN